MDAECFEKGFGLAAVTDPCPPKAEVLLMGYLGLQGLLHTLISLSLCLGRKEIHVLYPFKEITSH